MGQGFSGGWIINSSVGKITKAKEACAELGAEILPVQEEICANWRGEAPTAMQAVLNEVWDEIKQAYEQLASAEIEVREQGNYIINNWIDDES